MAKGKTNPQTWKSFERRVARMFGVERHSKTRLGEEVPDVVAEVELSRKVVLCVECKLRAQLSKLVIDALKEAEGYANDESTFPDTIRRILRVGRALVQRGGNVRLENLVVPIAVMKEKHAPDDEALVVMRLGTFRKLVDV